MLKILLTAVIVTVLFNLLSFNSHLGVGFSFFIVFINLAIFLLRDKEAKNQSLSLIFGILSSLFAISISYRSSGVVQLIDIISSLLFLSLNLYFSKTNLKFDFSFFSIITAPFSTTLNFVEGIVKSFIPETWAKFSTQKHVTSSLMRGLFIGIPILIVLFIILSRADPIFENITFSLLGDIWVRVIFSLIVFVSVLSLGLMKIFEHDKEVEVKTISEGKEYELLIILGGLAILFGGFIFIQFKYLFNQIEDPNKLIEVGIKSLTYSEYVRKGFFELLLASVISSVVILYVLTFIHKLKEKGKVLVQVFTSLVTIEVGLLLWSAAQRIYFYQLENGLTRARVFGMFFLIWLAGLLAILLIKIIKDLDNRSYLSLNIILTLIILFMVNFVNVDELMATKYKPRVNNEIDYYYLAYLSPDAHLSWLPAIADAENVYVSLKDKADLNSEDYRILFWHLEATEGIKSHTDYLTDKYGSLNKVIARHQELRKGMDPKYMESIYGNSNVPMDLNNARKWQSMNFGEYLAYEYIEENQAVFDKLPQLVSGLMEIRDRVKPEVINSTTLDRSTNPPLSN